MKNRRKLFGAMHSIAIIALAAVVGFGVAGCEQPTDTGTSTPVPVTGVTLDKATLELTVGGNAALTATVAPADATDKAVTWDSDAKGVATVGANGAVTAVSAGTAKITVTTKDGGKTAECTVTVNPVPTSIAITKQPDKTKYGIGDTLDITGIEVTATYSDNTTGMVTVTAADITGFNSATAGSKTLTVTYGGKTASFTVTVVEVSSIAITKQPDKTTYGIGDTLDITGLEVTATYSDNTTGKVTVTAADITGFNSATAGSKTLTVTYGGKTATFTITVVEISSIAVTKQPDKTTYGIGDTLDITGLEVTATYSDNSTGMVTVTEADITGFSSATAGSKTLTVTYSGKTTSFTVTVIEVTTISITKQPDKARYLVGDALDITGLEVTAVYKDNTIGIVSVTTANITGFDSATTGSKTLTVTYGGKTTTFTVTVIALTKIEITRQDKTIYLLNEQLDITSLEITATYSDNSTEIIPNTAVNIAGFNSATIGEKMLIAVVGDKTVTFYVTVIDGIDLIVTNTAEWNTAINTIQNGGNNQSYIITVSGNVAVTGSTSNTFNAVTGISVTLRGNGTLSLSGNGNILRIGANQTMIIDSPALTLAGQSNNNTSLVYIYGNSSSQTAKLELKNGTISGNTYNSSSGVGGGVYIFYGTFTMSGGTISGNTARPTSNGSSGEVCGGGAYIDNYGTFTMSGGTINGNTATGYLYYTEVSGGGVYVRGNFTMTGGTISGNTASNTTNSNYSTSSAYGGGVAVLGTFRMITGTIYGSNEGVLSNTVTSRNNPNGAALRVVGTAQLGTFNGETWNSAGTLSTTNDTIRVVNGVLQ